MAEVRFSKEERCVATVELAFPFGDITDEVGTELGVFRGYGDNNQQAEADLYQNIGKLVVEYLQRAEVTAQQPLQLGQIIAAVGEFIEACGGRTGRTKLLRG